MIELPCAGCGQCCMKAGLIVRSARKRIAAGEKVAPELQEAANFPYDTLPTGRCSMLRDDMTCAVYETRPDICNVEKTWQKYHSAEMTREQYFGKTLTICNQLKAEATVLKN